MRSHALVVFGNNCKFLMDRRSLLEKASAKFKEVIVVSEIGSSPFGLHDLVGRVIHFRKVNLSWSMIFIFADLFRLLGQLFVIRSKGVRFSWLSYSIRGHCLAWVSALILGSTRRVMVVNGLGSLLWKGQPKIVRSIVVAIYIIIGKRADHLIFHNEYDRRYFRAVKILSYQDSSIVFGSGVEEQFMRRDISDVELMHRFNWPRQIAFMGRFVEEKGVSRFVELAGAAAEAYALDTIVFKIYGNGETGRRNYALRPNDKKNCLVFAGNYSRDQLPKIFNEMFVLVVPSRREGCSRVIMEALAAGVPVIASDVSGCNHLVRCQTINLRISKHFKSAANDLLVLKELMDVTEPAYFDMVRRNLKIAARNFSNEDVEDIIIQALEA